MKQFILDIIAGFGLAVIFFILGIFFWPLLLLIPVALLAGPSAFIIRKMYRRLA